MTEQTSENVHVNNDHGVGASAGGVETIHEHLDNMPQNTSRSFTVLQHLSPDDKGLLAELVSKHTCMQVFDVNDKMTPNDDKEPNQLLDAFAQSLVDDFGYVCFCIDNNYEIKESLGNFNRFLSLPENKLNLNILKIVPQDLSIELSAAIRKCWKDNQKVLLKNVCIKQAQNDLFLSISVQPSQPLDGKPYTLIVLGESTQVHAKENIGTNRQSDEITVDRLEATNEELLESNEDGTIATFDFDMSDMIRVNQEIKKSESRFRFLAEAIPQKVWTALPNGEVDYFNKLWLNYTGKSLCG